MSIELITMWYNEEYLAPIFLNHYSWVDKINILLDADTGDNTEAIARCYSNVSIEHFSFPDMMDDIIKSRLINKKFRSIKSADYVIVVDSDEFLFCNILDESVKAHITNHNKDVYFSIFWQVYQISSDAEIDVSKPIYLQRQNGDPTIANCYVKPAVIKAGLDVFLGYGNHTLFYDNIPMSWLTPNINIMADNNVSVEPFEMLQGAHLKTFDLAETIYRRTNNRTNRQSLFNLSFNLTAHHHRTLVENVIEECNGSSCFPIVIKNRICSPTCDKKYSSVFETLLSDNVFTDDYSTNNYPVGVAHMLESCDLPWWSDSVKPLSMCDELGYEMFVTACAFYKNGNLTSAISIIKKLWLSYPDNIHYALYYSIWNSEL